MQGFSNNRRKRRKHMHHTIWWSPFRAN